MDYIGFGIRLREQRTAQKITQAQIAKSLHFSPQHIGNIERGSAHPSLELAVELANYLDVSLDYLLQDSLHRVCH